MIRPVQFESQDRREKQILAALNANGIASIEEANQICEQYGLDPYMTCEETQRICFENAKWAYVVGSAIALKKGCTNAADAAEAIGIDLDSALGCGKRLMACQESKALSLFAEQTGSQVTMADTYLTPKKGVML